MKESSLKLIRYKKISGKILDKTIGPVVAWDACVLFNCPCGERQVYVTSPPHIITFDEEDILTLDGSCGYRKNEALNRKANWCHFFLKNGYIEMCSDVECPGAKL